MRFSLEKGFDENQFRWCFWGSSSLGGSAGDFEGTNFGGDTAVDQSDRGRDDDDGGDSQSASSASFDYGFSGSSTPSQEEVAASFD